MKIFSILILFNLIVTASALAVELAKVNDRVISKEEFDKAFKENSKYFQYKTPNRKTVLDDLIKREVGILEAKKLGIDKDPIVADRIQSVIYQSFIEKKLSTKFDSIQVSENEVDSFYKKYPEIRTSHVFVQVRFDANDSQQKSAFEKIKRLQSGLNDAIKSGKTFAEFAHANSEGVAAATGGDIDYQSKDKLDPAYYAAAIKLSVGGISDIVRSQFGYHIIKLTAVRDIKDIDRGHYKRLVYDEKRAQIFDEFMNDLRKKYKISINSNLLKE